MGIRLLLYGNEGDSDNPSREYSKELDVQQYLFELRSLQIPFLPNDGSPVNLYFSFGNRDSVQRCYTPTIMVPDGRYAEWNIENDSYPCVSPGGTVNDFISDYPTWSLLAAADAAQTNALGQVTTTFTRAANAGGSVKVRAELLKVMAAGDDVAHEATVTLNLGGAKILYLPVVQK